MQPDWDRAKLETELATVQRVSRVAPRGKEEAVVNGLLGNGYTSALTISRQSCATFRRKTAASFGDEVMADTVHRNAPLLGGVLIDAVGGISTEVASDPTWFGNVDCCSCLDCWTVHGPAAYLVDLLTWLDEHDLDSKTAFERLSEQRPDTQRIGLSCENTNTVLPYIDLINEILEMRVLGPSGTSPNAPPATSGREDAQAVWSWYTPTSHVDRELARLIMQEEKPQKRAERAPSGATRMSRKGANGVLRRCTILRCKTGYGGGAGTTLSSGLWRLRWPEQEK